MRADTAASFLFFPRTSALCSTAATQPSPQQASASTSAVAGDGISGGESMPPRPPQPPRGAPGRDPLSATRLAISRGDSEAVIREASAVRRMGLTIPEDVLEGVDLAREALAEEVRETQVSRHFRGVTESEMTDFLERRDLEHRVAGSEINVKYCATCPPHGGKSDNLWKSYISRDSGFYFCHRCGDTGSWFDYIDHWRKGGGARTAVSAGDMVSSTGSKGTRGGQHADRSVQRPGGGAGGGIGGGRGGGRGGGARRQPPPASSGAGAARRGAPFSSSSAGAIVDATRGDAAGAQPVDPRTQAARASRFEESAVARDYVTKERGLSVEVAREYGVGSHAFRFETDAGVWEDSECLTFPWYNAAGEVVRHKVRGVHNKRHMRLTPAGGAWGLFGWNLVDPVADEIVITEGEFDAMAVRQATGRAAVSLPNGARSLPVEVLPLLEPMRRIYLWLDDDVAGQEGAAKFAKKLGAGRCLLVRTRGGARDGPKDANEALQAGADLAAMIDAAEPIGHEQILHFPTLRDEIFRELSNPEQVAGVQSKTLPGFTAVTKGHRRGELTVFTGPTGVGKTSILSQISLDYCAQGVSTLWGSFEISNVRLAKKMLAQYSARRPEDLVDQFPFWADRFAELPLRFMRFHGSTKVEDILDAMTYAVYVHDIEHVVLDNLQFMVGSDRGTKYERWDMQDRAISAFRRFATEKGVHISLVIHPRKGSDDNAPLTNNSVFGGGKATQEADNVVILQRTVPRGGRGEEQRYLEVTKNRFDGTLGKIPFWFDVDTLRFFEKERSESHGNGGNGAPHFQNQQH